MNDIGYKTLDDVVFIYKTKNGYEVYDLETARHKSQDGHVATVGAITWLAHFLNADKAERARSIRALEGK